MVTMSDIAKKTGLSKSTVSRVLNNYAHVSKEKRQLVQKAMEELSYVPSLTARKMRGNLTTTIGIVVPRIVNPFFSYLVSSMERAASDNGYQVVILQSDGKVEKEVKFLDLLKTRQIDGIILTTVINKKEVIATYEQYGAIVFCNEYFEEFPYYSKVRINNKLAAYTATNHLLRKGYKKIAFCTGELFPTQGNGIERNLGFQEALEEAGLQMNHDWLFLRNESIEDGKNVLRKILKMKERPDAIYTGADELAAGIILEANKHNLRVPKDLAVMGFDDQPLAELTIPKISTIRQPIKELGKLSVDLMIKQLKGESLKKDIVLPVELVVREST